MMPTIRKPENSSPPWRPNVSSRRNTLSTRKWASRKVAVFLVLLGSVPLPAASQSVLPQFPADKVVARVNGVALRGAELNGYVEAILPNIGFHGKVDPSKISEYRKAALDRMIMHELVYQEAVRRHIHIPRERIEREVQTEEHRFRSQAAFKDALARQGLDMNRLRTLVEHNLMVAEKVRRDILNPSKVSDSEARAYYKKNLKRFREPESVLVRHIFFPPKPESAREAEQVRQKALAKNTSEEFDRLAWKYSKDDYRVMGGMIGWVHRGRLEPEIEKAAFGLKPGQISEVIKTSTGYHLIRVEGRQPAHTVPFKEMRKTIVSQLEAKKEEHLRKQLKDRLYKPAKIEVLEHF